MNYITRTRKFEHWLQKQQPKVQALVESRLSRIEREGHFGIFRYLGDGLVELKWKIGIRVYFVKTAENEITVLLGGRKNDQKKDIEKAKKIAF